MLRLRVWTAFQKHASYPDEIVEVDRLIAVRVDLPSMCEQHQVRRGLSGHLDSAPQRVNKSFPLKVFWEFLAGKRSPVTSGCLCAEAILGNLDLASMVVSERRR